MRALLILLTVFCIQPLYAQNGTDTAKDSKKGNEDLVSSLNKEKRDVLLYGIDSEVLDVINTIRSEKDTTFNAELAELISKNDNAEINRAVFDYLGELKVDLAEGRALELLQGHMDDYDYSVNLLLSAIGYLGNIQSKKAGSVFYDLLKDHNVTLASAALRGIGKLKDPSRVSEIMDLLKEYSGDSEYQDFSASAILVLGELKYTDAEPLLEEILQDEDSPASQRQYSAVAIGQFQLPKGLELLQSMYTSVEDSLLRSYVLKGITEYNNSDIEELLISALRDSFWQIRVAAAEGLGKRKTADAVDILKYKVNKDPVRQVRYASLKALASIGNGAAADFIFSQFEGERTPFDIRQKSLDLMLKDKIPGSIDSLKKVLEPKWDKDKDGELGAFCKTLSTSEWKELKPFYIRMMANKDFVIRIYGIRGVKLNKIISLKDAVQSLDSEKESVNVRREAKAALESF